MDNNLIQNNTEAEIKSQLLRGKEGIVKVQLEENLFIELQPLGVGDQADIINKYGVENFENMPALLDMITCTIVTPKLTLEEVRDLKPEYFEKILEAFTKLNKSNAEIKNEMSSFRQE